MSGVYQLEPPTKGKVVLTTTHGDLDIELFAKEAPKACRNFVQLCLEGYYDGTIFHRIIKDFMIQGGDPTGTGSGGDTIYGKPFEDEQHSRLRFNHRGLVACANSGVRDTNNSQFFVTLDRSPWLDKKHTIFGKITGQTVYNLVQLSELETGDSDRPLDPPSVLRADVIWNPFDDIVPRNAAPKAAAPPVATGPKVRRDLTKLSFAGDDNDEDEGRDGEDAPAVAAVVPRGMRSSHDALADPRLLKQAVDAPPKEARRAAAAAVSAAAAQAAERPATGAEKVAAARIAVAAAAAAAAARGNDGDDSDSGNEGVAAGAGAGDFDRAMRERVLARRAAAGLDAPGTVPPPPPPLPQAPTPTEPAEAATGSDGGDDDSDGDAGVKKRARVVGSLKLKRGGVRLGGGASAALIRDEDAALLTKGEATRERLKAFKRRTGGREAATLAKLARFQGAIAHAPLLGGGGDSEPGAAVVGGAYDGEVRDTGPGAEERIMGYRAREGGASDGELSDGGDLFGHALTFDRSLRDIGAKAQEDLRDYVVEDPLHKKGMAKWNKDEARRAKQGREWKGRSLD